MLRGGVVVIGEGLGEWEICGDGAAQRIDGGGVGCRGGGGRGIEPEEAPGFVHRAGDAGGGFFGAGIDDLAGFFDAVEQAAGEFVPEREFVGLQGVGLDRLDAGAQGVDFFGVGVFD